MQFTNQIQQQTQWRETPEGFLRCTARILAERVMPYASSELSILPDGFDGDRIEMYVPLDEINNQEALSSLEGVNAVAGDHAWLDLSTIKDHSVGSVAGTPKVEDGYLVCDMLITDQNTVDQIKSGQLPEISAAYTADTVFEDGEFNNSPYHAKQTNLRFNHIAIIPAGHGRAGRDVRIINKGDKAMADVKLVRVRLRNTGRFVNVDEEVAKDLEENDAKGEESEAKSSKSMEDTMNQLEGKNGELAQLQSEIEELKGELSVYKEKLDQLLSEESIEHAASEMMEDKEDADEIIENMMDGEEPEDAKKKEEIKNSLKGVWGASLHQKVLNAIGVKCENMSKEAMRGTFKAQAQIIKAGMTRFNNKRKVAGANMFKNTKDNPTSERTVGQMLGFHRN